jgi:hypothetical protein
MLLMVAPGLEATMSEPRPARRDESLRFAPILVLWVALTVALNGALWVAGFRAAALAGAVEEGAARAESVGVGEVGDDLIRKAIRTQHDTRPFWTVVAGISDFLVAPAALLGRAIATATVFSAAAAVRGRNVGYERALAECAAAQGFWVLGSAVRIGLMIGLRSGHVETSAALFLSPGVYPAALVLALRELDPFVLLGWSVIARGAVRRGQIGWPGAIGTVALFAVSEAVVRIVIGLVCGAGMRLSIYQT